MSKENSKIALVTLKAIMKNRMKNEPIILSDIGYEIKCLAKKSGVQPKDLVNVLVPIYKEAIEEALTPKALKKSMKANHGHRHHRHGGH